jgi:uncharacterized protein YoaH (UPF0181 family)
MTFELTQERLQEIAVGCVTKFMSKQASLSEAIAKEAQDLELNSEQTKRVIEVTNTVAYLRQLEKSADRTFEFPVADYNHVMAAMCMPEDMAKQAGTPPWLDKDKDSKEDSKEDDKGEKKDPEDKDDKDEKKHKGEDFGKSKKDDDKKDDDKKDDDKKDDKDEDDEDSDEDDDKDEQEKRAMLNKGLFQAKGELERMAYDEASIYMDLVKSADRVARDPQALEKFAHMVPGDYIPKLVGLCGIEKRAVEDLVFTDKEMNDVETLFQLLKQAEEFTNRKAQLEDFVKRAEQVLFHKTANVEKLAFIGSLAGRVASGVGRVIGSTLNKGITATGKGFGRALGNIAGTEKSFSGVAKAKGFKDADAAVKHYDKLKRTQGVEVAMKHFDGKKPNLLVHRIGVSGAATALTGLSVDHVNNVKDL